MLLIKKVKLFYLVILLMLVSVNYSAGQNVRRFRQITINSGLAHTDATCFAQDSVGYIWIGTNSGLQRYDGRQLKSFHNNNVNQLNVYNNRITTMTVKGDQLWIGSEGGLSVFNLQTERFLPLVATGDLDSLSQYTVTDAEVAAQQVWFISSSKLYNAVADMDKGKLVITEVMKNVRQLPDKFADGGVLSISSAGGNFLGVGTTKGLIILGLRDTEPEYKSSYLVSQDDMSATSNIINDICYNDSKLWLMNDNLVQTLSFDHQNGEIKHVVRTFTLEELPLKSNAPDLLLTQLSVDSSENLWLATNNGLYLIEAPISERPVLSHFTSSKYDSYSLGANNLSALLIDRTHCLWIGSWGGGVSILDLRQKKFNLMRVNPEDPDRSLRGSFVRAIAEDENGLIWVGLRNEGINIFNPATGICKTLEEFYKGMFRLANYEIRAIKITGSKVYIGTTEDLTIFDLDKKTTLRIRQGERPDEISSAAVFAIETDSFGQVWIGTWGAGLNRIKFDGSGYHVTRLTSKSAPSLPVSSDIINNIYYDKALNELLVSTSRGLNRVKLDLSGEISDLIVYHSNSSATTLSSEYIWPLVKENDSVYWAGTLGGGLNRIKLYDNKDASGNGIYEAKVFTVTDGAPSNDIESLQMDSDGNLWMAGRGISMFSPEEEKFWNFDVNDGLQSNGFKIGSSCKCSDGTLYFGGIDGLNYFNPSEIKKSEDIPRPVIAEIKIHNKEPAVGGLINKRVLLTAAIHYLNEINLKYTENDFSLAFASLTYSNTEKCQYRFMLEGYDAGWNTITGSYPVANYSNLDYGRYKLKMFASNSDGIWSNEPVTLEILVRPPWWRSTFASLLYILFFIFSLYLILFYISKWINLRNNLKMVEAEEKRTEEMHQMKLQFFTNISHEFRTPLTLILSPVEKLTNGKNSDREQKKLLNLIQNNANRLLFLVNELMDFRKAETGKLPLHAQKLELKDYICSICKDFVTLARQKGLRMTFRSDINPTIWVDVEMMSKIIYNLFSNAIKYTNQGGAVEVEILDVTKEQLVPLYPNKYEFVSDDKISQYCYVRVRDTGIGISEGSIGHIFERYYQINKPSDRHLGTGVGLALLKSLVSMHHGYILVSSERYVGTEIIVGLPLGDKHLTPEEIVDESLAASTSQSIENVKPLVLDDNFGNSNDIEKIYPERTSILVVEDNDEMRSMLADHFGSEFMVFEARDGQEGFEIAVEEMPELIISDVMMPVMDGFEMIRRLKQDIRTSHIPIVLLSAKTSVESQMEGIESGAVEYIPKPFNMKMLDLRINRFLADLQSLKKKYTSEVFAPTMGLVKSEKDKKFMDDLLILIDKNIDNSHFSVDEIASELALGRSNLYKKIKSLTDQTLGDFIRTYRLKTAARMLLSEDVTVSEVTYRIGMNSHSYFTKSFKSQFNMTPSEFLKRNKAGQLKDGEG